MAGSAAGCHWASSTIFPGSPGAPYEPRAPAICTISGRTCSSSVGGSSLTIAAWHSPPRAEKNADAKAGFTKRNAARPAASSSSNSSSVTDAGAPPLDGPPGGAEGGWRGGGGGTGGRRGGGGGPWGGGGGDAGQVGGGAAGGAGPAAPRRAASLFPLLGRRRGRAALRGSGRARRTV